MEAPFFMLYLQQICAVLNKKYFLTYAVGWFIICTVLLTLPGSAFPKENWLNKIYFDKWVHIGLFSVLTFVWCLAVSAQKKFFKSVQQLFVWIALGGCVYGIAMEYVQKYFIPNRSFDIGDIIADTIGSLTGLLVATKLLVKK
jgi:VanZ family protein